MFFCSRNRFHLFFLIFDVTSEKCNGASQFCFNLKITVFIKSIVSVTNFFTFKSKWWLLKKKVAYFSSSFWMMKMTFENIKNTHILKTITFSTRVIKISEMLSILIHSYPKLFAFVLKQLYNFNFKRQIVKEIFGFSANLTLLDVWLYVFR